MLTEVLFELKKANSKHLCSTEKNYNWTFNMLRIGNKENIQIYIELVEGQSTHRSILSVLQVDKYYHFYLFKI